MDQFDADVETEALDDLAEMAWEYAANDNLNAAIKLLRRVTYCHKSLRMYEVQHSVFELAYLITNRRIFREQAIETIFGRLIHGMENPRLFLDIGDYFRSMNKYEFAYLYLLIAAEN
jgi:hypothetical protein